VTSAASAASITPVQGTQRAACGRLLAESGANAVQCAKRLVVERHAFGGPEGTFTACSFWRVEALTRARAYQGRRTALAVTGTAMSRGSLPLGLLDYVATRAG
jgi:hypothetical protein